MEEKQKSDLEAIQTASAKNPYTAFAIYCSKNPEKLVEQQDVDDFLDAFKTYKGSRFYGGATGGFFGLLLANRLSNLKGFKNWALLGSAWLTGIKIGLGVASFLPSATEAKYKMNNLTIKYDDIIRDANKIKQVIEEKKFVDIGENEKR